MNAEDKENWSSEVHESTLKTPLKQTATSSRILAEMLPPASGHLTTPPKPNEISPGDPWTPTANLKMLISAASPEIRNREQEKRLSDSRHEIPEDHLSGDEYEKAQPSRKEKSLGLLCHKFLARYPSYPDISKNNEICLDEVAEELNVERRRIYDIMNVLESLHMVSRLAKNRYSWHGRHNLKKTLQILKRVAEENNYSQQIELIKRRQHEEPEGDDQKRHLIAKQARPNDHTDICFVELPGMEFRAASVNSRKDKSLRVMSQKFVMLFLVSTPQVVNLEVAAKILIGEDHVEYLDKSKFKTKIRRLYDIANVLSSLELIRKVHVTEEKGRKPAFKWTGPDAFSEILAAQPVFTPTEIASSHPAEGKSSKEHCSKNLFPTRTKKGFIRHPSLIKSARGGQSNQRKIRSAPSSPVKKNASQIPPSFPSKMAQLATICKQQLDEQSREFKKRKMELEHSTLPSPQALPPKTHLKPKPFLLPSKVPSQAEILPPAMLPLHPTVPYALYLQPSQTQLVTAYSPSFTVRPVHCADVVGNKSLTEPSSQVAPSKIFIEDNGSNGEESASCAKGQGLWLAKEQDGSEDDITMTSPERRFKRRRTESSPVKKCPGEEVALHDVLLGASVESKKLQCSTASRLDQETLTSSAVKQSKSERTDQHMDGQPKQQRQGEFLEPDSITTMQEMPATFAIATHKTWFPSGYLIPLPHCTKLGNETIFSNKENAEMDEAEQKTYSSPIAGGIPVTPEFTAINFPAFHIAPVNLKLPASSVATVPVVNGNAMASDSFQNPSASVMSFTLQHLGLIPANLQMPANQVLRSGPVCQGEEHASLVSKSTGFKQEKKIQNVLPPYGEELNGNSVPAASLQQATVPATSSILDNGHAFQASCESAVVSKFCSSFHESDRISQATVAIPQREHGVSTEDKF